MAQHKMKQKTSLPKGAKQKSLKRVANAQKSRGPKKGANMILPAKKAAAVQDAKIGAEVTRIINEKNEELTRMRADRDVGKTTTQSGAGSSADSAPGTSKQKPKKKQGKKHK